MSSATTVARKLRTALLAAALTAGAFGGAATAAAPASASVSDCLNYLKRAGYGHTGTRVIACERGVYSVQECITLLTENGVWDKVAKRACLNAPY
ncbi:hypothetical protein [Nocardiopsis chromatogenes]|uniref:hypothetical protein n=1 Tax=Nocardiopsis chromatogenes TaxID=280239 RepID=UPI000344B699|nr:hypothetical protein [Nocardiopsis chromatogenes]